MGIPVVQLDGIGIIPLNNPHGIVPGLLIRQGNVNIIIRILQILPAQKLLQPAGQMPQIPPWLQGQQFHCHIAGAININQRHALFIIALPQGILQGRTGIAHLLPASLLGPVDMPQRRVGKCRKIVRPDLLHQPHLLHGGTFRACQLRHQVAASHKLMRHQHVACLRINPGMPQYHLYRLVIALDFLIWEKMAHLGGLHKGQQIKINPVNAPVVKLPLIPGSNVNPPCLKEAAAEIQPLIRVVVAANHKHLYPSLCQPVQKIIQQPHCSLAGYRPVVDITCQQHAIHLLPACYRQNLIQNITLVLQQIKITQGPAQMQIPQMQKLQTAHSFH